MEDEQTMIRLSYHGTVQCRVFSQIARQEKAGTVDARQMGAMATQNRETEDR